ncbi:PLD-like domain-containing protein [Paracoccus halophilus]|uniref:PLD-like domain-containing protein n=1 Tax=Paracoccus halophilus TaxID=376733 RepID=A0A1I0U3F4_9RHOB|nr:phospholipase D-like domain-containing protein [Paracoccus halophilus]SFA58649.1 PLD-like domain-containing protein [Paracoccus halophilus]
MLIPQLHGRAFVDTLLREIAQSDSGIIATAWVRASGVGLLWEHLTELLGRGGSLRIVAGIDRDNTSLEGLAMLLELRGDVRVWVRHNEAGPIFHPKLYAFRTTSEFRVLIGSNNLTGAGLTQNEELSGFLCDAIGGQLERSLDDYMGEITDESSGLVRQLDRGFLDQLLAAGYIDAEARLRGKAAAAVRRRPRGAALFASLAAPARRISSHVPLPGIIEPTESAPPADWKRVFVKLRLARGTQGQIPLPVAREVRRRLGLQGLDGPFTVIDRHSRTERLISPTFPERRPDVANTYKIEAISPKGDAILKLELIGQKVLAEFFDTAQPDGRAVFAFVIDGLRSDPPLTIDSRGAARNRAAGKSIEEATNGVTLYRFD